MCNCLQYTWMSNISQHNTLCNWRQDTRNALQSIIYSSILPELRRYVIAEQEMTISITLSCILFTHLQECTMLRLNSLTKQLHQDLQQGFNLASHFISSISATSRAGFGLPQIFPFISFYFKRFAEILCTEWTCWNRIHSEK